MDCNSYSYTAPGFGVDKMETRTHKRELWEIVEVRAETLRRCMEIPSYKHKTLAWKNRYYDCIRAKVLTEVKYQILKNDEYFGSPLDNEQLVLYLLPKLQEKYPADHWSYASVFKRGRRK